MIPQSVRIGVETLLLAAAGTAVCGAQQGALSLPLPTGAAIVQTLSFTGGDRESVHRVLSSSSEGLLYEWSLVEVHADGDTSRQVFRYQEGSTDVAESKRLWFFQQTGDAEAHPGYTMHALSRALYQRLRAGQTDSFQVMALETPGMQAGAFAFGGSRQEAPVRWRGTLSPVARSTVPFPLLVNGHRVQVPALRLRGDLTTRHGRWTPDVWILADSTYPLILKWVGAFREDSNVLQTVRVDLLTGAAVGNGTLLDGSLERELTAACRVELPGIYFAFNSAAIVTGSHPTLAALATVLTRHPGWSATLEGHTDSIGSGPANLALSQRRVEAVRERLVSQYGVSLDRLRVIGHGSARPREPNATIEGRARNRRVELVRECAAEEVQK